MVNQSGISGCEFERSYSFLGWPGIYIIHNIIDQSVLFSFKHGGVISWGGTGGLDPTPGDGMEQEICGGDEISRNYIDIVPILRKWFLN